MPPPGRPLPDFRLALRLETPHVTTAVLVTSVNVTWVPVTSAAVMAPPGVTVQVLMVVAVATDVPIPRAQTIKLLLRTAKRPLRIVDPPTDWSPSDSGPSLLP